MTLNVKNRIESDKKLVFFIVGLGIAFIIVGLFLLLLYKLYHEEIKEVKPVIVIGKKCDIIKRSEPTIWQTLSQLCIKMKNISKPLPATLLRIMNIRW